MFLDRSELTALAVLLTDQFGWNLSQYDCMPVPTELKELGQLVTNLTLANAVLTQQQQAPQPSPDLLAADNIIPFRPLAGRGSR